MSMLPFPSTMSSLALQEQQQLRNFMLQMQRQHSGEEAWNSSSASSSFPSFDDTDKLDKLEKVAYRRQVTSDLYQVPMQSYYDPSYSLSRKRDSSAVFDDYSSFESLKRSAHLAGDSHTIFHAIKQDNQQQQQQNKYSYPQLKSERSPTISYESVPYTMPSLNEEINNNAYFNGNLQGASSSTDENDYIETMKPTPLSRGLAAPKLFPQLSYLTPCETIGLPHDRTQPDLFAQMQRLACNTFELDMVNQSYTRSGDPFVVSANLLLGGHSPLSTSSSSDGMSRMTGSSSETTSPEARCNTLVQTNLPKFEGQRRAKRRLTDTQRRAKIKDGLVQLRALVAAHGNASTDQVSVVQSSVDLVQQLVIQSQQLKMELAQAKEEAASLAFQLQSQSQSANAVSHRAVSDSVAKIEFSASVSSSHNSNKQQEQMDPQSDLAKALQKLLNHRSVNGEALVLSMERSQELAAVLASAGISAADVLSNEGTAQGKHDNMILSQYLIQTLDLLNALPRSS